MKKTLFLVCGWILGSAVFAADPSFHYLDLSKSANRGVSESFDGADSTVEDLQEKNGFKNIPVGIQTFRGIPFQILDGTKNNGHAFVVLKGRRKPDFPEAVSISADHLKAAELFFLHTCRWGGTAPDIKVAEYDVVYDDGQVLVIPLHVGVELTNFWYANDTASSFVAWWQKYKSAEMSVNLFPWKNPRPGIGIQTILFKSLSKMPVPILFAVTVSDQEVPISAVSPKPEKTFQTDTSKWIPLTSGFSSLSGTALDMGALLDAPAGKHGKLKADGEKIQFEDGTEARFWGTRLGKSWTAMSPAALIAMTDQLASLGCNLVQIEGPSPQSPAAVNLSACMDALKAKGIYVVFEGDAKLLPESILNDSSVLSSDFFTSAQAQWNIPATSQVPFGFQDDPMVLHPEESLPAHLASDRALGRPYQARWEAGWPGEYLAEVPLLMSAYASFENWQASLGMTWEDNSQENSLEVNQDFLQKPVLRALWPTAALAYLRGDLKAGKLFVVKSESEPADITLCLKSLAHQSGFNPASQTIKTDMAADLKTKIQTAQKSFTTDTGQISWQGNVGVVKIESPRFQALIGFLSHRKFNNTVWNVETPNLFASLSIISLNRKAINVSDHLLVTGVTRMENTGMIYNQTKTKLLEKGKGPILVEPLEARIVLYRFKKDPGLKVRALDINGKALSGKLPIKWVKNNLVVSWIPSAFYFEILK